MVRHKAETFEPVTKVNQNESWLRRGPRGSTCSGRRDELDYAERWSAWLADKRSKLSS
jgi:hypothetical protein